MWVLIPCYFNSIIDRRERFKKVIEAHITLGNTCTVLWMNDSEPDIMNDKVLYIKSPVLHTNVARNKLLKMFYKTEEAECILSDDDTILNNNVAVGSKKCVSFTNDYKKGYTLTSSISTSFLVLKNIGEYFDENMDANQDLDFGIQLNKKGIETWRYSSDEVNVYRGKSSMFKNKAEAIYRKRKALEKINRK